MGIINNLVGKKFGRLTVLNLSHITRKAYWFCKCDCGKEIIKRGVDIISGNTKSCGCYRIERPTLDATGEKSPNWKGDLVGKTALHTRLRKLIPNRNICKFCKKKCKTDLANISQKYKTTEDDWMWLCRECHMRYDDNWIFKIDKWFKICKGCSIEMEVNTDNFYRRKSNCWLVLCKNCNSKKNVEEKKGIAKRLSKRK